MAGRPEDLCLAVELLLVESLAGLATTMDAYLDAGDLWKDKKGPLFRSVDRHRELSERPMHRNDVLDMMKRRAKEAGLSESTCCHTFSATGITAYLG